MTTRLDGLRLKLEQLVDQYVTSGAIAPEVIDTIEGELQDMRRAYDADPDPADEPGEVEEPADDWPAASQ